MKLIIIFGPPAVGKMTVGHALEKITGLKLFHNHMTIDLVAPFFDYGTATGKRLVYLFRREIFEEVAKSDLEGLIFTYVWNFDEKADWDYVDEVCEIFESRGGTACFVELEANLEERLERNRHPHRLSHKPTKRNIEKSDRFLKESMEKHRMNSEKGEIRKENYVKINNMDLTPEEVAEKIKGKFKL
jgi:hypothetical protein